MCSYGPIKNMATLIELVPRLVFRCLAKLGRFRKFAAVLLLWLLSVNLFIALLWLRPSFKTTSIQPSNFFIFYERNRTNTRVLKKILLPTGFVGYIITLREIKIIDSDIAIVDSKTSGPLESNASFVFVVPRRLDIKGTAMDSFTRRDKQSVLLSAQMLKALSNLDGLACLPRRFETSLKKEHGNLTQQAWKGFFNSTWCNFARKDWSIQIRNNGLLNKTIFNFALGGHFDPEMHYGSMLQMCNIINGPFLIRKEKFMKLRGLKTRFGRLTLLDFFMRSNGKLKIGKFGGCFYGDNLFYHDRGVQEGLHDFPEYSNFGLAHGILRIIMEDRIEWTKCVAIDRLCKEKPYVAPSSLPQAGQPICCSVVLGKMLKAVVAVFNKLGIKYRLLYGTLLGALRSGAIIPYTHDIDFAVDDRYGLNWSKYDTLQEHFEDKYSISSDSFMGMPRLLPLVPAQLNINTSIFFDGELDLEGKKFFSQEILNSIQGLLPFASSDWRKRGYTDFYRGWPVWWNGSSIVMIDGFNYTAMTRKEYEVELWYGKNWRTPILGKFERQDDAGAV